MVPGFTDQDAYQSVFTIGRMEVIAAYQKQEWVSEMTIEYMKKGKRASTLCLATMWRTTSDIGKIQWQDVSFTYNEKGTPTGATIIESEPKEGQAKRSRLGAIEESLFCPMKTSWDWMQRFHDLRIQLPVDHTLFLTYVDIDYK
ncbi:hypothetical protein BDB00DRAFT_874832 [Zychaea mexicana]|uniref:uncharacterized protein n=1 Tax=Zychaea mexicana TaxID=64656 RepID=UPI0022FE0ED4|nr:uncharacterized protein BDB00DRAFT_874832 [Zychaea mexicana]KAI9490986.1 hypothetical protein BDB00DRAFT_874832 [Zychaea mexicana]